MAATNPIDAVEAVLVGAVAQALPPGFGAGQVAYPNAAFSTPGGPWLRLGVVSNYGPISGDATGTYEVSRALFVVSVFYPEGAGTRSAWQAAQHVKDIFDADGLGDLCVEEVVITPTSEPAGSHWYGLNVNVTFTFESYLG